MTKKQKLLQVGETVSVTVGDGSARKGTVVRAVDTGTIVQTRDGRFHGVRFVIRPERVIGGKKFDDFTTPTYPNRARPVDEQALASQTSRAR